MNRKLRWKSGDYLIVTDPDNDKRRFLARAKTDSAGSTVVDVQVDEAIRGLTELSIPFESIVATLGPDPTYGRAYGCLVEPLRAQRELKNWGELKVYRKFKSGEKEALASAFNSVGKWLDTRKVGLFRPLTIEVRNKSGRYAGKYKFSSRNGDSIVLHPEAFDKTTSSLLIHECFHGIWFRQVPLNLVVKWIALYTHYTKAVTARALKNVRIRLERAGSIRSYRSEHGPDPEDGPIDGACALLDSCLAYLGTVYGLTARDINILLSQGQSLDKWWPENPVDLSRTTPILGDYATTNVDEFFAEAGRLMYEGIKLPKKIRILMKKTLSAAAGNMREQEG